MTTDSKARANGPRSLLRKIVDAHLAEGTAETGRPIALRVDQTLMQDANGTLVMLALEAMGIERSALPLGVQYVDHNLLQADHRNADDHRFLRSAAARFGLILAPPGTGISHVVHMAHFGRPGAVLLGGDSHTPAAGALGMLGIGAGGLDLALAMAGAPHPMTMPSVRGVRVTGRLPPWVGAKDVALEMLRRHGVAGGRGAVWEWFGPGLDDLSVWDRHVIANMGTETGAVATLFPADDAVRDFLTARGRANDAAPLSADAGARYDDVQDLDLSTLEPLVATPSSPGNVVPVSRVAGAAVAQVYLGSSANPGWADAAIVAEVVAGGRAADGVSLDVNPASRDILRDLVATGHLAPLIEAGARLHQVGCNGCIGMGQAPASGRRSLRTVPRNFPGRSGTVEDAVYLSGPQVAAASALRGAITDPRTLDRAPPRPRPPARPAHDPAQFVHPPADPPPLDKGPSITAMPVFDPLPDDLDLPLRLRLGDDVSTDEILPGGAGVLPWRSNPERLSAFTFRDLAPDYAAAGNGDHAILAGANYGQGSSREHAAMTPRMLGLRVVLADTIAGTHARNLVNFGVLPLSLDGDARDAVAAAGRLRLRGCRDAVARGAVPALCLPDGTPVHADWALPLSDRQTAFLLAGGCISWARAASAMGRTTA
ncbi:aconitate hydratase [Jannaschia sp. LMIT008]|uniref:aconitate hydratase n=1 Tax=Jannaschia maritima TaxID=3032585 RepID=UPI002810FBA7|nr:aconitate hydratase [Jannaschia sp. LMIT008]